MNRGPRLALAMAAAFLLALPAVSVADTITISYINGDWKNPTPATHAWVNNLGSPHIVRWGDDSGYSGYDWLSATSLTATTGVVFSLGTFTHHNNPITSGTSITSVDLDFDVGNFATPSTLGAMFLFSHNETPNDGPCAFGSVPCPDKVTISNAFFNAPFTVGGAGYYFTLLGFSQNGGGTISTEFITLEERSNVAGLYAVITSEPIPEPVSLLLVGTGLVGLVSRRAWKHRR